MWEGVVTDPTMDVDHHLDWMSVTSLLFKAEECGRLVVMKSKSSLRASCRISSASSGNPPRRKVIINCYVMNDDNHMTYILNLYVHKFIISYLT